MSQFTPALHFVLDNEDARRKYAITPDAPPGAFAISGINSFAYPEQYKKIAATDQSKRAPLVADFYDSVFWEPSNAGLLVSQDVANRVLDQSVNGGLKTGPMLLQRACSRLGQPIREDGDLGPASLAAANSLDPAALLSAFKTARIEHYQAIVKNKPQDARYLPEWIARASK